MKKLLSILMLLVAIVTGAWGAASTTSDSKYASGTITFADFGEISNTTNYWYNGIKFFANASGTASKGNSTWSANQTYPAYAENITCGNKWGSGGSGATYSMSGLVVNRYTLGIHVNQACTITVVVNRNLNTDTDDAGITASVDATAYATGWTTGNYATAGTALTVTSSREDKTNYPGRYTLTIAVTEDDLTDGEAVVKMFNSSSGTGAGKLYCFESVTVTGDEPSEDPTITAASTASIKATESGVAATTTINVTGANLTGSTLTATLSPAVTGLSVSLDNDAISEGAISATATVSYTATENAKGTTTLTISDGTTSKEITVNYRASVAPHEQTTVSDNTTWDISGITGDDVTGPIDDGVFADLDLTLPDGFDDTALKFVGATSDKTYVWRTAYKCSQDVKLNFRTTVPGRVTVYYGNTGSNTGRYVQVNGVQGAIEASKTKYNDCHDETFFVAAGDVNISYTGALRFFKVVFEKVEDTSTITLNAKGYATYSNASDFEFAGATAYKMALNEDAGTIAGTKVTGKIAAGEGILFKGDANATVTIAETTGATALEDNSLKGTTTASGKATVPTYCYTLSGDTFKKFKGAAFNDNKAYLESENDLSGQTLEIIFDDQPTAINFVVEDDANVAVAPVKTIKNGQLFIGNYNVAGARIK